MSKIVYILTNQSMPETIKIGITDDLESRMKQLENDLVRMITSFTKTAGEIFPQDLLEHTDDNLLE